MLSNRCHFVFAMAVFDRSWRLQISYKLQTVSVGGEILLWVKDILLQPFCGTRYDDCTSKYKESEINLH